MEDALEEVCQVVPEIEPEVEPEVELPEGKARKRYGTVILQRTVIATVFLVFTWYALGLLRASLDPNYKRSDAQIMENERWIATSKYWLDRNACRYIGVCGLAHWHPDPPQGLPKYRRQGTMLQSVSPDYEEDNSWKEAVWGAEIPLAEKLTPEYFDGDKRVLKEVPQFVLDAAPLIHLYSGEEFWPSDIGEHLTHMIPHANYTFLNITDHSLWNLDDLNKNGGRNQRNVFLNSAEDVETRPAWLSSAHNRPTPYHDVEINEADESNTPTGFVEAEMSSEDRATWFDAGAAVEPEAEASEPKIAKPFSRLELRSLKARRAQSPFVPPGIPQPDPSGRSPAPVILVLIDKGNGILDAFWFYFYSYNLGTTVFNIRFGNHVGDWEHSLIRFHHGVPKAVFFSAHSGGTAYTYNAVEKGQGPGRSGRPVLYSAMGSHAMFAMPGKHPYILPFGILADVTDKGPLWDPALNYYAYHYNATLTHDQDAQMIPNSLMTNERRKASFVPAASNPQAPTSWFWFSGHWGDKVYTLGDWRQWRFVGQYHYVDGPLGPRFKNLGRSRVCQGGTTCTMLDSIDEGRKKNWLNHLNVLSWGKKVITEPETLFVLESDDVE